MVFLDWLSVYQDHKPGSLPVLGADWVLTSPIDVEGVYEFDEVEGSEGSAFVHFVDFQTGEVVERPVSWKSVRAYQHPGSFDTKLRIRCDGSRVTVSGNPSAFCRMDNLFGFTEVSQAVDFYNVILQSLGMPSFVDMRSDLDSGHLVFDDHGRHVSDGRFFAHSDTICEYGRPIITAIHITENIETGLKGNSGLDASEDFLVHLSGYQHYGRAGYLYPNRATVDWQGRGAVTGIGQNGPRRMYHKYYRPVVKFRSILEDLQKKLNNNFVVCGDDFMTRQTKEKKNDLLLQHILHLENIITHCESVGLVRHEIELKSTELIDRKLRYIENWSNEVMSKVIYPYQFHNKLKVQETRLDSVLQFFLDAGYSHTVASKCHGVHRSWINGDDINLQFGSHRSKYVYRKLLLMVGVDIFVKCDISRLPIRVHQITVSPAKVPEWYVFPSSKVA